MELHLDQKLEKVFRKKAGPSARLFCVGSRANRVVYLDKLPTSVLVLGPVAEPKSALLAADISLFWVRRLLLYSAVQIHRVAATQQRFCRYASWLAP